MNGARASCSSPRRAASVARATLAVVFAAAAIVGRRVPCSRRARRRYAAGQLRKLHRCRRSVLARAASAGRSAARAVQQLPVCAISGAIWLWRRCCSCSGPCARLRGEQIANERAVGRGRRRRRRRQRHWQAQDGQKTRAGSAPQRHVHGAGAVARAAPAAAC